MAFKKKKKDLIVILGGTVKNSGEGWHTCDFNEGDKFGVTGDRLRVLAGFFVFKKNRNCLLIASGGEVEKGISVASVIKKELIDLGVPSRVIIEEDESYNTYQQLKIVQDYIKKKSLRKILFITNKWHTPRVREIIKVASKLSELRKKIEEGKAMVLEAEKIVLNNDKSWEKKIKKAYESLEIKERIILEKKGVRVIREGLYKFK